MEHQRRATAAYFFPDDPRCFHLLVYGRVHGQVLRSKDVFMDRMRRRLRFYSDNASYDADRRTVRWSTDYRACQRSTDDSCAALYPGEGDSYAISSVLKLILA